MAKNTNRKKLRAQEIARQQAKSARKSRENRENMENCTIVTVFRNGELVEKRCFKA